MFSSGLLCDFIEAYADVQMAATLQLVDKHTCDCISRAYAARVAHWDQMFLSRVAVQEGVQFKVDPTNRKRIRMRVGLGVVRCRPQRLGMCVFKCVHCKVWKATKRVRGGVHCPQCRVVPMDARCEVRVRLVDQVHLARLTTVRERLVYYLRLRHDHRGCRHRCRSARTILSQKKMY